MASVFPDYGHPETSPIDIDRSSSSLADTLIGYVHSLSPDDPLCTLDDEARKLCERVLV